MVTTTAVPLRVPLIQRIASGLVGLTRPSVRPALRTSSGPSQERPNRAVISGVLRVKIIAVFVVLSVSVSFFYLSRQWATGNPHDSIGPFAFTGMVDGVNSDHFQQLQFPWKPRIAGMWMAAEMLKKFQPTTAEQFRDVFGAYNTAWFFASLLLLVIFLKEPVFPILATFAGVVYGISVCTYNTFYDNVMILPWDIPAVFFFTLSFLLWQRKWYWSMLTVIVVGTLFKESVALTAILLFFSKPSASEPWLMALKRQMKFFAVAFFGCLAVRLTITHFVLGQATTFTAAHGAFGLLWGSTKQFLAWEFHPHLNTILWADGGLAAAVFLLPRKTLEDWGIITILALFYAFLTITPIMAGSCYEVRQWSDILPMLAIYFQRKLAVPMAVERQTSENFPSNGMPRLKGNRINGKKQNRRMNEPVFV